MKIATAFLLSVASFAALPSQLQAESSPPSYEQELNRISTDLSTSLSNSHVKIISISSFTDLNGETTDLSELLTEDLTVDLVNQNKDIAIIDRSHRDQVDDDSKPDVNKIDAVITGMIIPLGPAYRIEVKVMATGSGKLLAAKRFLLTRTAELDGLMGITSSDDLASQDPNAPTPFPNHTALSKTGLTLWLKADAGMKTDSRHRVIQWRDLSGQGNNASQPEAEKRPIFVTNAIHGKPAIQLDGSNYLSTDKVVTTGQDYSVFIVSTLGGMQNVGSSSSYNGVGPLYNGAKGHTGWGFGRPRNPQAYGIVNQGTNYGVFGSIQNPDGFQLLSATRGSGITSFYAFGAPMGTDSFAMDNPTEATYIGTQGPPFDSATNLSPSFSGKIAEIIVYDHKLSDEERQSIERYLAAKYDLKLNPAPAVVPPPVMEDADGAHKRFSAEAGGPPVFK